MPVASVLTHQQLRIRMRRWIFVGVMERSVSRCTHVCGGEILCNGSITHCAKTKKNLRLGTIEECRGRRYAPIGMEKAARTSSCMLHAACPRWVSIAENTQHTPTTSSRTQGPGHAANPEWLSDRDVRNNKQCQALSTFNGRLSNAWRCAVGIPCPTRNEKSVARGVVGNFFVVDRRGPTSAHSWCV